MKKPLFLLLLVCSNIYAESRPLPPVIDSSIYPKNSARKAALSSTNTTASANVMYDVLARLEQLQSEVQQLRGEVESQSRTIVDLKRRQGNIYTDLDMRLQELSKVEAGELVVSSMNSTVTDKANVAAGQLTSMASSVVQTGAAEITNTIPVVKNEAEMYQSAYQAFKNGHNTQSITAFKSLLATYPTGEFADNSQYWLGEAYKANGDLSASKVAFKKVVTHYRSSAKVPGALLKLGYIELSQNNTAQAKDYLTQVAVNYPGTKTAQLATDKLMTLGVMQR